MKQIKSDLVAINGVVNSKVGGRPENQDDFVFVDTPVGFLLMICDGMGGGPGGKTASYIVKYEVAAALGECNPDTPREQALKIAIARANSALNQKMDEIPSLRGMGSTFVAILVNSHSIMVAHAGDSRCYQIRNGKCIFRSVDHSLVSELVRTKALTEEQARMSPQSNIISRGLGSVGNNTPEIEEIPYRKGDRFVLCTDGVWGIMSNKDLMSWFSQKTDIPSLLDNISSEIDNIGFSKGGGHDNHTLAIVDMGSDSELKSPSNRKRILMIACVSSICMIILGVLMAVMVKKDNHNDEDDPDNPVSSGSSVAIADFPANNDKPLVLPSDTSAIQQDSVMMAFKEISDSVRNDFKNRNRRANDEENTNSGNDSATTLSPIEIVITDFGRLNDISSSSDKDALALRNELWDKIDRDLVSMTEMSVTDSIKLKIQKFAEKFKAEGKGNYPIDAFDKVTKQYSLTREAKNRIASKIKNLNKIKEQLEK